MDLKKMSWLPKLGAFLVLVGAGLAALPKLGAPLALAWVGPLVGLVGTALGLAFARQDNRSSEQVGAGNVPPLPVVLAPSMALSAPLTEAKVREILAAALDEYARDHADATGKGGKA